MPRSEKVLGRTFLSYIGGGQDDVICVKKAETPTFAIFCLKYAQISGKFKNRNLYYFITCVMVQSVIIPWFSLMRAKI